eukprot:6594169-Prymnesium_polylepis.1
MQTMHSLCGGGGGGAKHPNPSRSRVSVSSPRPRSVDELRTRRGGRVSAGWSSVAGRRVSSSAMRRQ